MADVDEIELLVATRRKAQVMAFVRENADDEGAFRLSNTVISREARIPKRSVEWAIHELYTEGAIIPEYHVDGVARVLRIAA